MMRTGYPRSRDKKASAERKMAGKCDCMRVLSAICNKQRSKQNIITMADLMPLPTPRSRNDPIAAAVRPDIDELTPACDRLSPVPLSFVTRTNKRHSQHDRDNAVDGMSSPVKKRTSLLPSPRHVSLEPHEEAPGDRSRPLPVAPPSVSRVAAVISATSLATSPSSAALRSNAPAEKAEVLSPFLVFTTSLYF